MKMLDKIHSMKIDDNCKPPRGGMEPLILDDLNKIVDAIDDRDPYKKQLSSLFLFGLSTGLRGHSCEGI